MISKKVAILQSNYIPWKGYFDMINMVDEFIIYDDCQYTKNDWRNRNRIKTRNGSQWITIPVNYSYPQKIRDTKISYRAWNQKHWKTIKQNYSKAPFWREHHDFIEDLYWECNEDYLSEVNYRFIKSICELLGLDTRISWSMDYNLKEGKTERLVDLCVQAGADEYISGPAAKCYIDENLFIKENIRVTYMDYSGYPQYDQLYLPFEHNVSIIDLILNMGPKSREYLKSF